MPKSREFTALSIAIVTVSNRHTRVTDTTGAMLAQQAHDQGHRLYAQHIVAEDKYQIRALLSSFIADSACQVVLLNGGTGFQAKNCTSDAIRVLFDRQIDGFGELFRQLSFSGVSAPLAEHAAVYSAAIQSDAIAGLANNTLVIAMPGSLDAANLAATHLIWPQLDARTLPCNFAHLLQHLQCPSTELPQ